MSIAEHRVRFGCSGRYPAGRVQVYIQPRYLFAGYYRARRARYLVLFTVVVRVAAGPDAPALIDEILWRAWLNGHWRRITRPLDEQLRAAAVDAVLRFDVLHRVNDTSEYAAPVVARNQLEWWK